MCFDRRELSIILSREDAEFIVRQHHTENLHVITFDVPQSSRYSAMSSTPCLASPSKYSTLPMERDDIVDLMTAKVQGQVICSSLVVVFWLPSFLSGWWEYKVYHGGR